MSHATRRAHPLPRSTRAGPAILACLALAAGCRDAPLAHTPDDVAAFVRAERLPAVREYSVLLRSDSPELLVFSVSFGPPHDCPSGCFYSGAVGIRHGARIGWVGADLYDDSVDAARLAFYDFDARDAALFTPAALDVLSRKDGYGPRAAERGLHFYVFDAFAARLARDGDTPEATLVDLARRLPERWSFGPLLVDAATARRSLTLLRTIAELPPGNWDHFQVRERARAALAALGG